MESYINNKKKLYTTILEFVEKSGENSEAESKEYFQLLSDIMKAQHIERDLEEMKQFLLIIKSISENHHRDRYFIKRINEILQYYKEQIKQTLSNIEIYHLFENDKMILLFLFENNIVTITDQIYKEMIGKIESNGNRYWYFFYPEIEKFIGEEKMKDFKNEILSKYPNFFDNFDDKRKEGQNDFYICSLIREDSIEEFISYINRQNYSVSSKIKPSNFETNLFLIENKDISLIEYSAFFGSIQIFQYLKMNNVQLTPSLWLYTIHSKNAELIHLLESSEVQPPELNDEKISDSNSNYIECLIESIKCHHNDFADYIENNLLCLKENDLQQREKIFSNYIKYHNYSEFQTNRICEYGFFYLCFYNYSKLIELFLKMKEKEIKLKIIQIEIFFNQEII